MKLRMLQKNYKSFICKPLKNNYGSAKMNLLQKIKKILDTKTKKRLIILLIAIIIGAFVETLTLAMISPLISVLMDETVIYTNSIINWVYNFFGFTSTNSFLAFLAFLLAFVNIFRGIYFFALTRIKNLIFARSQAKMSKKMLDKILGFSYIYHTKKNIAQLQRIVLHDVGGMFRLIMTFFSLLTDFFMSVFIISFLLVTSPTITMLVALVAILSGLLFLKVFRKKLREAGIEQREANISMVKSVNQSLGGIKEVKILNKEKYFQKVFQKYSRVYIAAFTRLRLLNSLPKAGIETIFFGSAFIGLGIFILSGADVAGYIPQLGIFVMAAFRLLPAVSRQVGHIGSIIAERVAIDSVYANMFEEVDVTIAQLQEQVHDNENFEGINVIELKFQYPDTAESVFDGVSLKIPDKTSVALVGPSGSGKTTLADLILGVLLPDGGSVLYNGMSIHHNFDKWSKNVGYIPQQIYLLDESIRENIAFGIEPNEIDDEKIWKALEQAQLKDFVISLPDGIETIVGDRGVRLSGGQRQRIGIARAMYNDPQVLVLDEATSALDNETETAVMEAVMGFKGDKTMIIIAHRLSTIENCDIVYRVEGKAITKEVNNL